MMRGVENEPEIASLHSFISEALKVSLFPLPSRRADRVLD